ncbi:MAG: TIGR01459 family HAD-type hydrolase [Pseudomonadota bacterium]
MHNIYALRQIAHKFEGFVVDQWGVLHDGETVFPGAHDCLKRLKQMGKDVILLSNSGKRVATSYERFKELGISSEAYRCVVTSGEHVYQSLKDRTDPFYSRLGHKFYIFAWDHDRQIISDLDYEEIDDIAKADFVLCAGVDRGNVEAYMDDLKRAKSKHIPLIVVNPDLVSQTPDGSLKTCPGSIALAYQKMGGVVKWHGKPQRDIYKMCAFTHAPSAYLAIGDSLSHDIKGGLDYGLSTLLIGDGIHKNEILNLGLKKLSDHYDVKSDYYMQALSW